jgi:GTP:adenosylcobinamide-phosphate guanylyltransferase
LMTQEELAVNINTVAELQLAERLLSKKIASRKVP